MNRNGEVFNKISNKTVQYYQPLIKYIARKYIHSGEPIEDLEQIAYLGLINALNLFDESRGVKFETYATWLINGEIRHYIRDKHTVIRIPHWEQFRRDYERFPSISEMADYFNITQEGISEILKGRESVQVVSLDSRARKSQENNIPILDQIKSKEYRSFQLPIEDIIQLKRAINALKKIQKDVIYYLFVMDLTQTKTAEILGITQRQVSRVKQDALDELRKNL